MTRSRREFIRDMGTGLSLAGTSASGLACASVSAAGESEKLLEPDSRQPEPSPLGLDRLPLEWHQETT